MNDAVTGTANFPLSGVGQTASSTNATLTVAYDLPTRGYTITNGGRSLTFLPTDIDNAQSTATVTVYKKVNGTTTDSLTLTKPGTSGRFTYEFVGGGYWQRTVQGTTAISGSIDAFSYGIKTADANVPRTGAAQYLVDLIGAETVPNDVVGITGTGTMQVNFANGAVITHGRLDTSNPNPVGPIPQGYFSSEAKLSSNTNGFSGNFRYFNFGEYSGQLNGRFYGPTAQEVGAAFQASEAGGNIVVGTLIGRKGTVPSGNTSMTSLARNEFFANNAATLTTTLAGTSGTNNGTETFSNSAAAATPLIVNYDADQRAYTVITPTRSQYFLSTDRSRGTTTERFGDINLNSFFFSNFLPSTQYVLGRRWYTRTPGNSGSANYTLTDTVFGIKTPDANLPRTGRAGYNVALVGSAADADAPNLTDFGGRGVLSADFATGAITASGTVDYREDYFISGRPARTATGAFNLTSTLSSTANSFAGTINLTGIGSYSGPINGQFFGPTAEEVGASFTATDGSGGGAVGMLTGIKDPNIFAVVPGLLDLAQPTLLTNFVTGDPSANNLSANSYLRYTPATQTYSFFPTGQPTTNAADLAYAFGPGQVVANQSNATFTRYQTTGPANQFNASDTVTAAFFNPGSGNPQLVLTHTSFADFTVTRNGPVQAISKRDFVVFGIPTPAAQAPRTGTGTYTGVAYGAGNAGATALNFDGTSSLSANFGAGSFTASVALTARDPLANTNFVLAPLTFAGSIFNGTSIVGNGINDFLGTFFGPNAAEFGAAFAKNGNDPVLGNFSVRGVAVGRKN